MLAWRLGISAVLIPLLLALFRWDLEFGTRAPVLLTLCLMLTIRGAFEATDLLTTRSMKPSFLLTSFCNVAIILSVWATPRDRLNSSPEFVLGVPNSVFASLGVAGLAFAFSFVVLMLFEAARYRKPGSSMESLGANLISVGYSGMLLAVLAHLRWYPEPSTGYFAIGSVIIAVKGGDVMAYTFGRLWGKRKMIPTLSPGKTWMGGVGAIVGSAGGTWLWCRHGAALFETSPAITSDSRVLLYGASLGVIGLIGDLCESLIKRDAEKKDSATLMPGFGGLLDLIDSPLYAAPFALTWWVFWPPAV